MVNPEYRAGRWTLPVPRSETDQMLLTAAGLCLPDNLFVAEVAALLDATDELCARQLRRLTDDGYRRAVSVLVQSTFTRVFNGSAAKALTQLGGSIIAHTCDVERMFSQQPRTDAATATGLLAATTAPPRWGRLVHRAVAGQPGQRHRPARVAPAGAERMERGRLPPSAVCAACRRAAHTPAPQVRGTFEPGPAERPRTIHNVSNAGVLRRKRECPKFPKAAKTSSVTDSAAGNAFDVLVPPARLSSNGERPGLRARRRRS